MKIAYLVDEMMFLNAEGVRSRIRRGFEVWDFYAYV